MGGRAATNGEGKNSRGARYERHKVDLPSPDGTRHINGWGEIE